MYTRKNRRTWQGVHILTPSESDGYPSRMQYSVSSAPQPQDAKRAQSFRSVPFRSVPFRSVRSYFCSAWWSSSFHVFFVYCFSRDLLARMCPESSIPVSCRTLLIPCLRIIHRKAFTNVTESGDPSLFSDHAEPFSPARFVTYHLSSPSFSRVRRSPNGFLSCPNESIPSPAVWLPAYGFLRLPHYIIGYIIFEGGFPECQTFFRIFAETEKKRETAGRFFSFQPPSETAGRFETTEKVREQLATKNNFSASRKPSVPLKSTGFVV